ncbi:MAG TPA: HAMP domain-containing sensor histidine kinase [Acidimicrobiia bacterium]
MGTEGRSAARAPISYIDVRSAFNTTRAVGGLVVVILGLFSFSSGWPGSPYVIGAGVIVMVDGVMARSRGVSALPRLVIDLVVVTAVGIIRGQSNAIGAAAVAYLLTASILLLPLRRAVLISVLGFVFVSPVGEWVPAFDLAPPDELAELADGLASLVFLGLATQMLFIAARALRVAARRNQEALESERRASQLKNEFVSMVSHELRTPLTSIGGFAETLRESWSEIDAVEIDEFLMIMGREASHLGDLVEDILVIPRLEAGQLRLEPTDLSVRSVAYQTGEIVFQGSDKEFSVSIPIDVTVVADHVRTKQILRNLLENARKYGGDQILVEGEQTGDLFQVVVADNGPGVPEGDRERIFEHFEQLTKGDSRSDRGFGLGLPIARKLARAMGGDLWHESRFPTGSRFCFTLRVASPAERDHDEPVRQSSPAVG